MDKITILFVIGKLEPGGAERQLIALLRGIDKHRFLPVVATYYEGGKWEEQVKGLSSVRYHCLGISGRLDILRLLGGINRLITIYRPSIIFGIMGDACTTALLGRIGNRCKIVWGLRATSMDFSKYSRFSGWIYKLNARLSRFAHVIVSNSWSGRIYHSQQGYRTSRIIVIPNGIDTDFFCPSPDKGRRLRSRLGLNENVQIVGRMGRFDPMKDYPTFVKMAQCLVRKLPDVYFLTAGGGNKDLEAKIRAQITDMGIESRFFFLGQREDMSAVYSACDITCSSSLGEGFPNVVAESMACERPCAATDVGDTAKIIGEEGGMVVPARDPQRLATAAYKLLSLPEDMKRQREKTARKRILEHFSIRRMVTAYEDLFTQLSMQTKKGIGENSG